MNCVPSGTLALAVPYEGANLPMMRPPVAPPPLLRDYYALIAHPHAAQVLLVRHAAGWGLPHQRTEGTGIGIKQVEIKKYAVFAKALLNPFVPRTFPYVHIYLFLLQLFLSPYLVCWCLRRSVPNDIC